MTKQDHSPFVCRRRFLTVLGTTAAAATAGAVAVTAGGCSGGVELEVLGEDVVVNLQAYPQLAEVEQTVMVSLEQLALPLAITRLESGGDEFAVTGTECNHNGCTVQRKDGGWECPCHGAQFDLDGGLRRGPADQPLVTYDYEVDGNEMTIFSQG